MDLSSVLSQIKNDNIEEFERVLKKYNQENCRTFTFDRKEEDNRIVLCQGLLSVLQSQVPPECQRTCLESLRILSRDKRVLSPVATRSGILLLAGLAGLGVGEATAHSREGGNAGEEVVAVETLKCLCNVIFNSPEAQRVSADLQLARGLCARLRAAGGPQRHQVELFSLRLIFLLSALDPGVRVTLQQELCAVGLLTSVLERTLDLCWVGPYEVAPPDPSAPPVPAEENERVMEALKALFNLTLCDITDGDGVHQFRLISGIMRHILMLKTLTEDKTEEVHSHAVNLLSNIPAPCLDVLVDVPVRGGLEGHDGKNMEAVQVLLAFMERRIDKGTNYKEGLTPVLSLLTASSRCHREIRRYIKAQVLPPLTDVMSRPEVGNAVRNKLVRLMTHVDMAVKQSAAEFLFVLCKESVDNLLKYTGYGNAAGLLMGRGLLAGGRGEGEYSEDEDSDTEEYKSARPFINPITGHVEEPAPNPFEEMTEEQKEMEAEKLVTMFDKLSRQELIRPMGVRRDGSLVPLEDAVSQCTVDSGSESD